MMALIREILKTDVTDPTIAAYGGCDVGMLASAGKLKKLIFGFVSLDVIPMEIPSAAYRSAGEFEVMEVDEGMFQLGLKAAAQKLPFAMPGGPGVRMMTHNPDIKIIQDPYKGENLVAMPAIELDLALCHVSEADVLGNSYIGGPDMFFDEMVLPGSRQSLSDD